MKETSSNVMLKSTDNNIQSISNNHDSILVELKKSIENDKLIAETDRSMLLDLCEKLSNTTEESEIENILKEMDKILNQK